MAHAFISYVRADADKIDRLTLDLYRQGIDTWTDRDIRPGQRWKVTIRQAIRQGASFLACFSPEVLTRERTYMYEEITTALEVLRQTPADRTWFIPVRLDRCEIPELEIGAGVTLGDFQRVDLAIESNVQVFERFSQLLTDVRDRYAARTAATPGHPASSGDPRSQRKIATLKADAARSKRRSDVRRAAEALVRRGDVTLATECPRGHGTLREWEGLPRCWDCGWPWKDFDIRRD